MKTIQSSLRVNFTISSKTVHKTFINQFRNNKRVNKKDSKFKLLKCTQYQYIASRFQIAIDVKTIIIEHVYIKPKFCLCGAERTKFGLE